MKKIFINLLILIIISSCSLLDHASEYGTKETFKFESAILSGSRSITVVLPKEYTSAKQYPIVYILDGDWNINHVPRIIKKLTESNSIPKVIMVFVGNNDGETRTEDYLFPADPDQGVSKAEADKFLDFLKNELIPYIDLNYSTSQNRTIVGHSAAGYFVTYSLLNDPGTDPALFKNYIAASPPAFWADNSIFNLEQSHSSTVTTFDRNLFIGVGSLEGAYFNISVEQLYNNLYSRNHSGFNIKFTRLNGISHNSSEYLIYEEGLNYVFNN